jgi:hypothetical protein
VDDGVRAANTAFDVARHHGIATDHGEPRMAHRHAARITNQCRDVVPILERLGDHAPTGEARGAEDTEFHCVLSQIVSAVMFTA